MKNALSALRLAATPRFAAVLTGAGFAIAAAVVAICAIMLIRGPQDSEPGHPLILAALLANLVLILVLAGVVGLKVARRLLGRRFGEPAPRLHLRFLAMFSLAAAVPAVLVAVFLGGVLTRGVDYWFGERVSTLVEGSAAAARGLVDEQANETLLNVLAMENDLNRPDAVQAFEDSRIQYVEVLRLHAEARLFAAAYIVDSRGTALASAEIHPDVVYIPPSARLYELAEDGDLSVSTPETSAAEIRPYLRALYRLDAYEDAYLYVYRAVGYDLLFRAEEAVVSYRDARDLETRTRLVFVLVYLEGTALILLGAVWLALSAATRVVRPVGNLVAAAERVRRGDLDARVEVKREDDEIAALGRAFNRMTRQLRGQRRELMASHAQSERRRAFTEAVLAGVSAGVIGLDEDDRITLVNRSSCALLEMEESELIGARLTDAAPDLALSAQDARRRPGEVAERQADLARPDGTALNLNVRAVLDAEAGLVLTFDDVTRLVAAQRNAAWRDVARRIAHEIKNPLTPIQLSAERLRRKYRAHVQDHDPEIFDRCTETIVRQVGDIGRMVDEFSAFARMPVPRMETVEMGALVQEAVFAQRVATPAVKFEYEASADPVYAECDARLASQALGNILKNASESVSARVDADGGKAARGRITVNIAAHGGFAEIEVVDNGIGWPTPDRERMTEPYMTTREKGTGLGLAIVKRVMEDHRGRLELDVAPSGEGALVRLCFPLVTDAPVTRSVTAEA